ncbi:hypothetical protein SSX86_007432 [Deinandra increscens subsp. villosa]|uniref:Uncharacterized protein n=1 Tax=Deinandra increscens subsp. villosa TaxID=3103831 RepID=A0AAP0H4X3_9ASTR
MVKKLVMWVVLMMLIISSNVTKTKGSSRGVELNKKTKFFKTTRPPMGHKYVYDGAAVNGFLPKAVPIPPSGPSRHHNSVGIYTMQP